MAETNVIKEFLVALGFKSDEASLKKFETGINQATKAVFGLAAAIEGTAVLVAAGVARFASNLEQLYFASIRTGTSATSLKAFERAAQDFGATAGEAQAAVEGLAHALRANPFGTRGLLQTMGIDVDKEKDLTVVLEKMHDWFVNMPTNVGLARAGALGIPENVYLAIRNGDFAKQLDRTRALLKDSGLVQASVDAHNFMDDLRDLGTIIEALGYKVEEALSRKLGVTIKQLERWLQINGPLLADRISNAIIWIITTGEWLIEKIEQIIGKFVEWDKATGGWSTKILGLVVALKILGGFEIIGGILNLAAAFTRLGTGIAMANAASAAAPAGLVARILGGGAALAGEVGLGIGAGWALDHFFPNNWLARAGNYLGGQMFQVADRGADAVRQFENMGWTHEQAAGIVANLMAESHLNPDAIGDSDHAHGVAQWHDDNGRWQAYLQWATEHNMASDASESQYAYVNYEARNNPTLMAAMRASRNLANSSGYNFSKYFERPAGGDDTANARGVAAVNLSLETTIHVSGGGDPAETARQTAALQGRVASEVVRNVLPSVQ